MSDSDYFEDFAQGPEGTSVAFAERLAEATYRDEHLNVRAQFQQFQTIDNELPDEDRPYARAPRILASGDWGLGLGDVDYGFDAELVNFEKKTNEDQPLSAQITQLADVLTRTGDDILPDVEALVDMDQFMRFWAAEVHVGSRRRNCRCGSEAAGVITTKA